MNIIKRMQEINARKVELRSLLEGTGEVDLDQVTAELRELDTEYQKLEQRKQTIEGINAGTIPAVEIPNPVTARAADTFDQAKEYRNAWLKTLQGKPLTENEQRAYSTAAASALAAIPESTANEIIKKMYEVAPILQKCKIFHVPGNFKFAVEGANADAALHAENADITAATDKLGSVSLTGYEIVKLVKASRATVNMTISAFESYIVEIIAEAIARKIENYIFVGTGNNQPGGVAQGGKGTNGAYKAGVDMVETTAVTEANITTVYGMLTSGYERNAVWTMSKATFFADYYALMNKSKNNLIEFANGKYYIMGCEVYFTASLAAGEAYLGDFAYIVGNYSQDITVVKSEHSGLATNSVDYLGSCVFDSKPIAGLGAFVKIVKKAA
jgi:HK97 family phage major capsid protein